MILVYSPCGLFHSCRKNIYGSKGILHNFLSLHPLQILKRRSPCSSVTCYVSIIDIFTITMNRSKIKWHFNLSINSTVKVWLFRFCTKGRKGNFMKYSVRVVIFSSLLRYFYAKWEQTILIFRYVWNLITTDFLT